MNTALLIITLLLTVGAQATTLGSLKGIGTVEATSIIEGETTQYTAACEMAMDVDWTAQSFSMPFASFNCGGTTVWNEGTIVFDIINNELISGEASYGRVDGDRVEFTYAWTKREIVEEVLYNENCHPQGSKRHLFNLDKKVVYKFTKMGQGYSIIRNQHSENIGNVYKKTYPHCPAHPVPVKTSHHMVVKGDVL
jgi:hypothetical protein